MSGQIALSNRFPCALARMMLRLPRGIIRAGSVSVSGSLSDNGQSVFSNWIPIRLYITLDPALGIANLHCTGSVLLGL